MNQNTLPVDVEITDEGSIIVLTPLTAIAREWIAENVQSESWQWFGASLCVDHRIAEGLIDLLRDEGFEVRT